MYAMLFANAPWLIICGDWSVVRFKKAMPMQQIFFLLTRGMLERLSKDEMERWTMIAWAIWVACNKFCFEDFSLDLKLSFATLRPYYMNIKSLWQTNGHISCWGDGWNDVSCFFLCPACQASMYSPRAHQDPYLFVLLISLF